MGSLASFHKLLSPVVGLSEAALYERQKALVRIGVLPKATGRGWASGGATATPLNVAWILISLLATDNLSEVAAKTVPLGESKLPTRLGSRTFQFPKNIDPPFPREATLVQALAFVLANPAIATSVDSVVASRDFGIAMISWLIGKAPKVEARHASFEAAGEWPDQVGFLVRATLSAAALHPIAELLSERD